VPLQSVADACATTATYKEGKLCPIFVRLVTDAGNEVRMTEREVHSAFHRPKWIRRIDTYTTRMERAHEVLAKVSAEVERSINIGSRRLCRPPRGSRRTVGRGEGRSRIHRGRHERSDPDRSHGRPVRRRLAERVK